MVRFNPRAQGGSEDSDAYQAVNLEEAELLTEGDYEAIVCWAMPQKSDPEHGWRVKLGLVVNGEAGYWWVGFNTKYAQYMMNFIDACVGGEPREVDPGEVVGARVGVRIGPFKDGFRPQRFWSLDQPAPQSEPPPPPPPQQRRYAGYGQPPAGHPAAGHPATRQPQAPQRQAPARQQPQQGRSYGAAPAPRSAAPPRQAPQRSYGAAPPPQPQEQEQGFAPPQDEELPF